MGAWELDDRQSSLGSPPDGRPRLRRRTASSGPRPARHRRLPLARTVSPARWDEYRRVLHTARNEGYEVWSLEEWLLNHGSASAQRAIVLRHDVDQHPRSVLPMLAIEREFGVRSTWYFRWRTAHPAVVARVRAAGGDIGLHYETLTRLVRERRMTAADIDGALVAEARELLCREIAAFSRRFGPLRSVCPHGDSRVPGVTNQILLKGEDPGDYGIEFDGNAAINDYPLSLWLTDRSIPDGRWKEGIDPFEVLGAGTSPILFVIHPNNWVSGPSLWADRILARVRPLRVPADARSRRLRPIRTGSDAPPPLALVGERRGEHPLPPAVDFASVAHTLRREVLRFYYEDGKRLTDRAGLNTLATNAELADSRAAMLEYALTEAGVPTVRDLDVLDIGCGFGALAAVFGARGARVLAVDPNATRMEVGRKVAELHGLSVAFETASMQEMNVAEGSFDVAVMNNSLCYLVDRRHRREALRRAHRALRHDGVLVIRNPNRLHPRDQFTGIPLLGTLPPAAADLAIRLLRRHRSRVRLLSRRGSKRELRRAGFDQVRCIRRPGESWLRAGLTGYHHFVAVKSGRG